MATGRKTLRIYEQYFRMIADGTKTVEIRVGYGNIKGLRPGDVIVFQCRNLTCEMRVAAVRRYESLSALFDRENPQAINPRRTAQQQLADVCRIYGPDKEALGVYAIQLEAPLSR
jgi:ASC-1-like (ASCH) protein